MTSHTIPPLQHAQAPVTRSTSSMYAPLHSLLSAALTLSCPVPSCTACGYRCASTAADCTAAALTTACLYLPSSLLLHYRPLHPMLLPPLVLYALMVGSGGKSRAAAGSCTRGRTSAGSSSSSAGSSRGGQINGGRTNDLGVRRGTSSGVSGNAHSSGGGKNI